MVGEQPGQGIKSPPAVRDGSSSA
ncbi:hypothetical protein CCACVL1_10458 [Corchorus capsularis]|uniref:Uncharacterized protein n=1 Tax=Corchorus capsularis TaxID=210143 RepID=A0A1R3IR17_COCAP|nr:hypothetical protein CCACVL1_10458 [Corchorus capsularis]